MEQLLHYVWKHKLFPLSPLTTTWHQAVEVIDPGLHNRNAGPDFFNAKIKLNGTLWVGNVEIHDKASDWYVHGHDKDERYDNVILHVCGTIDVEAKNSKGEPLVQLQLDIPENVSKHYQELLSIDQYPPCYQIIPSLTRLTVHSWMSALQTERLSQKTDAIETRVKQCNGDWENAYFVTLARNYGFGIKGLPSAAEGRRPSPRRPLPDRSHLSGASRTAGAEHHSRKISERRTERRVFLPIEERISLSLA